MSRKAIQAVLVVLFSAIAAGCDGQAELVIQSPAAPSPQLPGAGGGEGAAPVVTQGPADLWVSLRATPSEPSLAGELRLEVEVSNHGTNPATQVMPTTPAQTGLGRAQLQSPPVPAQADLAPGGSHVFTFIYETSASGSLTFAVGAEGLDDLLGGPVTAPEATVSMVVAGPSVIAVESITAPLQVMMGDVLPVELTVSNHGQSTATSVAPAALLVTGLGRATLVSGPTPASATLAPGASATFRWEYEPTVGGMIELEGSAISIDGASGLAVVSNSMRTQPVELALPASLVSQLVIPADLVAGEPFTATMLVTNTGTSVAHGVLPSPLVPQAAGATLDPSTVMPVAVDLAGGSTVPFSWTFIADTTGTSNDVILIGQAEGTSSTGSALMSTTSTANGRRGRTSMAITSVLGPTSIARGQSFQVSMTVQNTGADTLAGVVPSPNPPTVTATGGAAATGATAVAPRSIAPGAFGTFTWTFQESGTGAGTLSFRAGAGGTNAVKGWTTSAASTSSNLVSVVAPAALSATLASPPQVSLGQQFTVSMTVMNTGGGALSNVAPTLTRTGAGVVTQLAAPSPVTSLTGGASATFSWTMRADAAGAVTFSGAAAGANAAGAAISSPTVSSSTSLVAAATSLAVDSITLPLRLSRGQPFTATVVVRNAGNVALTGVRPTPTVQVVSGTPGATTATVPAAVDLAPGAQASFSYSWVENGTAPGTLRLSATAAGTNGALGTVTSPATLSSLATIESPASLVVTSISAPTSINRASGFAVSVTVRNDGQATANSVRPSPSPLAVTPTGGAAASTASTLAPVNIAGGTSATFNYSYLESGTAAGTLVFRTGAVGTDANSAAALTAATASSNTVQVVTPAALRVVSVTAPSSVTRGQSFTVSVTVQNSGGVALTGVVPSPAPPGVSIVGGAAATTTSAPAPVTLASGASTVFTYSYLENGTAAGSLTFATGARGTDPAGAVVAAASVLSSPVNVLSGASLQILPISLPVKLSRGQPFSVAVSVRNNGGTAASAVLPVVSFLRTGGANASVTAAPVAQSIAAATTAIFNYTLVENGTDVGTLRLDAAASGATGSSTVATIESAANLTVSAFALPASITPGAGFSLSMTVFNTGQASATQVISVPNPPTVTATGGVAISTVSAPAAVTILGGSSMTFTWQYTQSTTVPGTLSFTGGARGVDVNSSQTRTAANVSTNTASVGAAAGCNGSLAWTGMGSRPLQTTRVDILAGNDTLRVTPYPALKTEFARALGSTPSSIVGQESVFGDSVPRWWDEPDMQAISTYQLMRSAFQGCLTYTAAATQYSLAPTAASAQTECGNFIRKFWSRAPGSAELNACAAFATDPVNNPDPNVRRRWAYTCTAVLSSVGFIAQ